MNLEAPHVGFVIGSYAMSITVLAALVIYQIIRSRRLRNQLERLEKSGAARRPKAAGS